MKKATLVLAAVLALVIAFGVAGYAYAQTQTLPQPFGGMMGGRQGTGGYGHMGGMMGGYQDGSWGGGMMGAAGQYGPMHEYMVDAVAEALELTPTELQSRIEAGESMWDIAAGKGLSNEEITALMQSAHNLAIEQAVAAGTITPEQAEWMNSHMGQMNGYGAGGCHGAGGRAFDGPNS